MTITPAATHAAGRELMVQTICGTDPSPGTASKRRAWYDLWDHGHISEEQKAEWCERATALLYAAHAADRDTPLTPHPTALAATARALYVADHGHNPYAPSDWDNMGTTDPTVARYTSLTRTVLTTYHQETP